MKTLLLFVVTLFVCVNNSFSQSHFLSRIKTPKIDAIVDSLRKDLRADTIRSSLFYISSDMFERDAYGCMLFFQNDSVTGYRLLFKNDTLRKLSLNQNVFRNEYNILKNLFIDPWEYLLNFPDKKKGSKLLFHDARDFFFFEDNNKTILNREYYFSLLSDIKREQTKKIIGILISFCHTD